jgi:CubicO group peptidase (beta-lactamase class C family)
MNALKKTLLFFALLLLVGTAIAYISGNGFLVKAIAFNFANVDDFEIFENDTVSVGQPQAWNVSKNFNKIPLPDTLQNSLESIGSLAFLVIKNGEVLSEKYWDGYSDSSLSGSFSVAKSITSLLIGCAIKDGNIKSVDQPVGDFIPSFAMGEKAKMTIRHLLTMTSGTDFNESYANPFSITTEIYYGTNLAETAESVDMERPPRNTTRIQKRKYRIIGNNCRKSNRKKAR